MRNSSSAVRDTWGRTSKTNSENLTDETSELGHAPEIGALPPIGWRRSYALGPFGWSPILLGVKAIRQLWHSLLLLWPQRLAELRGADVVAHGRLAGTYGIYSGSAVLHIAASSFHPFPALLFSGRKRLRG